MFSYLKVYGSRVLSVLAIVSLVGAGIIGQLPEETDTPDGPSNGGNGGGQVYPSGGWEQAAIERYLNIAFPDADTFELLQKESDNNSYLYQALGDQTVLLGYVTFTEGYGYAGKTKVMVTWSPEGTIIDVSVVEHSDESEYFEELHYQNFFDQYIGRSYTEPLILDKDIDSASGASYSSMGVAGGVSNGRKLLASYLVSI